MRNDADTIIRQALEMAMPANAVREALTCVDFKEGKVIVVSIGKAGWEMANTANNVLGNRINKGIVITKYSHSKGAIGNFEIYEAGHPVPDDNGYRATEKAIQMVGNLTEKDTVLFLISGGGSALFESPLIPDEEMKSITSQLLACGASIVDMNIIRKRLSAVKGGKFALKCQPAEIYTVVLSDVIGDPLDMIASGPAYPDSSTSEMAKKIAEQYGLKLSERASRLLDRETPKILENVRTFVSGSVRELCQTAVDTVTKLGYEPHYLTASLSCEAREAGKFLGAIARDHQNTEKPIAFICGGETVVHLTGTGKGGRNQEIALAAAKEMEGLKDTVLFSFGSDGTDGPTDAAGGCVDGTTGKKLKALGYDIDDVLRRNDAYNALKAVDGLIITGPTGTNVNDLTVLLIK